MTVRVRVALVHDSRATTEQPRSDHQAVRQRTFGQPAGNVVKPVQVFLATLRSGPSEVEAAGFGEPVLLDCGVELPAGEGWWAGLKLSRVSG